MKTVKMPIVVNAGGVMIRKLIVAGPDLLQLFAVKLEQDGPSVIARRKKNIVVDYEGRCRADGGVYRRTPGELRGDLARTGREDYQSFTREKECIAFSMNVRGHRRRVA